MNTLNFYQREIIQITGCQPDQAQEIEDYMRNMIFGGNLEHVKCTEFSEAAHEAFYLLNLSLLEIELN
jgi:hypothetical protein